MAVVIVLGDLRPVWHRKTMSGLHESHLHRRLVDALYSKAMVLADEARTYFDAAGRAEREALDPLIRVSFSCESLKVTTRLMHVIAWLLTQRAVEAGELQPRDALDPSRRLGDAPVTEQALLDRLPTRARTLIEASTDLHRRVGRLDRGLDEVRGASPALSMQRLLAQAF
jgi:regulator of CtrA degradation